MVTITRVKYPKAENILEVDYIEPMAGFTTPPERNNVFKMPGAHQDLRKALDGMRIHFGVMGGWIKPTEIEDIGDSDHMVQDFYYVSGFNFFTDKDGINSIMITGYHMVMDHAVNTNSPKWTLTENGNQTYVFAKHLNKVIGKLNKEICRYMFENKRAQLALDLPDAPVTKMQVAEAAEKTRFEKAIQDAVGDEMKVDTVTHEEATGGRRKAGRPRKVAQTAAAPGGVIHDAEFEDDGESGGMAD